MIKGRTLLDIMMFKQFNKVLKVPAF
jgi:hypothetical protein